LISIHELIHELVLDDAEDVPSSTGAERAFPGNRHELSGW
jgi:hypothetical protein